MLSTTLISIIFGILITLVSLLLFLFSMYKCCKKDMEKMILNFLEFRRNLESEKIIQK